MNPETNTQSTFIDPDADNRLSHGLNPHCLAHIFQYVDTKDLLTLGGMNEYFKEVINNWLLQNYKIQVIETEHTMDLTELFEKHGKFIKKFAFITNYAKMAYFLQQIDNHCAINQFKHTEIEISEKLCGSSSWVEHYVNLFCNANKFLNFPIDHFRKVQTFWLKGTYRASMPKIRLPKFESLRVLNLYEVKLDANFDWSALKDVIELDLVQVAGINIDNFLQFIRQKPKLEKFIHVGTFTEFQKIGEKMAEHCQQIHSFSDFRQIHSREWYRPDNSYNYLSGFRNLRKLSITSIRECACELLSVMVGLAENNLLTNLSVISPNVYTRSPNERCDHSNRENKKRMKKFTDLKTIHIHHWDNTPMQLLIDYSTEILSNVETVIVTGWGCSEFIKFVPKLRKLFIDNIGKNAAIRLVYWVGDILEQRKGTKENGNLLNDSIEIIINKKLKTIFHKIENIHNNIKFTITEKEM